MAIEFYNVKTRQKVSVDESNIKKVVFNTKGGTRYGLRAMYEGTPLTKFISKETFDSLSVEQSE